MAQTTQGVTESTTIEKTERSTLGNTSNQGTRARGWCLTINNYDKHDADIIKEFAMKRGGDYVIGFETGTLGTEHLQVYLYFKNAISFNQLKLEFRTAHIEKAKSGRVNNFNYCTKEGNYITNMDIKLDSKSFNKMIKNECMKVYKDVIWKNWQSMVLKIIDRKPHPRFVHWIYDKKGNSGKSFLVKYLCLTRENEIIIADGKKNDIFNQVKIHMEKNLVPRIAILDVPRSCLKYVSYTAIEKLKDGCIYSGKYEGGKCIFPSPHVFIFANEYPNTDELSSDRWKILKIGD